MRTFTLILLLCLSCGESSNILRYLTPNSQYNSYDVHTALGTAYFDAGDIKNATAHAEKAFALNPDSEKAAILLANCYLAKAGISAFSIVKNMMSSGKKKSSSSGTNSALGGIGSLINLSATDFKALGKVDGSDPTLPVIVPVCAGEARVAITKLNLANRAIAVLCRFVNPKVLIRSDGRHNCTSITRPKSRGGQELFSWAMAHMIEAAAFNAVVNYSTVPGGKSNLELRSQKVEAQSAAAQKDPSQIGNFVQSLNFFSEITGKIIPTGDCSAEYPQTQLVGLMDDLNTVNAAFTLLPGIPTSMTKSISGAIKKIQAIQASTKGAESSALQSSAVKQDLTAQISQKLGASINNIDPSQFTPAQISQVCTSYSQISGGATATTAGIGANFPSICK